LSAKLLLELDSITAGYDYPVVGPISFKLYQGEILGLHGANGIGKSTILRAITSAAKIFSGHIKRTQGKSIVHHRQRPEIPPELLY
jgi:ABC-2 type transport system ATP-binding protein